MITDGYWAVTVITSSAAVVSQSNFSIFFKVIITQVLWLNKYYYIKHIVHNTCNISQLSNKLVNYPINVYYQWLTLLYSVSLVSRISDVSVCCEQSSPTSCNGPHGAQLIVRTLPVNMKYDMLIIQILKHIKFGIGIISTAIKFLIGLLLTGC